MKPLTETELRAIKALHLKGNDSKTIAKILHVPRKIVRRIVEDLEPVALEREIMTGLDEGTAEKIAEFERILMEKDSSAKKGHEIWQFMKDRHISYKKSWQAESLARFNFPAQPIALAFLADFHLGHEGVDLDRLEKDLRLIAETPGMYMIFLGDAMDNFIDVTKHQEAVINAVTSPKDQLYMLQYALSIFKAPSEKILLVTKDNHVYARLKKACGIDYTNKLWSDLNIFYGGEEILAQISLGGLVYNVLARHSYSGKSKVHLTASCKSLLKNGKYENIDIVALGHIHVGDIEVFPYRGLHRAAIQASTYKLYDPYAKGLGFEDGVIFSPTLILYPDKKEYTITPSVQRGAELLNLYRKKQKPSR